MRLKKEEIKLQKELCKIDFFKRDSNIYTFFEDNAKDKEAYEFCLECYVRNDFSKDKMKNFEDLFYEELKNTLPEKVVLEIENSVNFLKTINGELAYYYLNISPYESENEINNFYVTNLIEEDIVVNALGKKRANYFKQYEYNLEIMLNKSKINQKNLTKQEKNKLLNELKKYDTPKSKTIVEKHYSVNIDFNSDLYNTNKSKKIYLELDLTKPLEDIIQTVTKLKKEFDKDHTRFPSAYELLGGEIEPFYCELKNCDILKHKNPKPLAGRMADILFIYDCKRANKILGKHFFTNEYITKQIENYWNDIKHIYDCDSFASLKAYYKIAKDYIDNKRYREYISGVKAN